MISPLYNEEVDKAFKQSVEKRPLSVSKHYTVAGHAIRHTVVIHLLNYMENKGLEEDSDFLISTYLADEKSSKHLKQSPKIQGYIKWINTLKQNNFEDTMKILNKLNLNEMVESLIHLWVELIFLDYKSDSKETKQFIKDKLNYTRRVLEEVGSNIGTHCKDPNYLTMMEVIWTELLIAQKRLNR